MFLDREGTFRIQIREFNLYEAESGAVGINLIADVLEQYNFDTKAWDWDWRPQAATVTGCIWIIQRKDKGGGPNSKAVESLVQHAGWDGDINSVASGSWQPSPCQAVVKADTYKDETQYKIAFINGIESTPGGGGNVSPEKARELANRFSGSLRGIIGNIKRNSAPPPNKPAPPPARAPIAGQGLGVPASQTQAAMQTAAANGDESIPF